MRLTRTNGAHLGRRREKCIQNSHCCKGMESRGHRASNQEPEADKLPASRSARFAKQVGGEPHLRPKQDWEATVALDEHDRNYTWFSRASVPSTLKKESKRTTRTEQKYRPIRGEVVDLIRGRVERLGETKEPSYADSRAKVGHKRCHRENEELDVLFDFETASRAPKRDCASAHLLHWTPVL